MKILNVRECADYLRCSESSVRNMIRKKELEFFRIGAKINFLQEDIDNWIEKEKSKNAHKDSDNLKVRSIYDEEYN